MGTKITTLNSLRGCAAETSAAAIIFAATEFGVPVSTTQTVTGAIAGTGLVSGLSGTNWPIMRLILLSWLITIPATGLVAGAIITMI
jgi:inorganic phosphate transporter, PiT family